MTSVSRLSQSCASWAAAASRVNSLSALNGSGSLVLDDAHFGGASLATAMPSPAAQSWSAVIRVRQVDGNGELLKAVGLDELLLVRCPGGERE